MKRIVRLAIVAVALFAIGFWTKRMLAIDIFLYRGGRLNYASATCELSAPAR